MLRNDYSRETDTFSFTDMGSSLAVFTAMSIMELAYLIYLFDLQTLMVCSHSSPRLLNN
jgi:hypothetical protein